MAAPPAYIKIHALTNLQFLCRLCAGNIKNRIDESLSLARNPTLKETCEKFLHIQLDSDDLLPKLICKACYRTVAGAEALANVAKQTQKVFGEYFEEEGNEGQKDNNCTATNLSQQSGVESQDLEYTPLELNLSKKNYKRNNVQSIPPTSKANVPMAMCPPQYSTTTTQSQSKCPMPARKAEVVVNVSVNDPLTRDNQQKMMSHMQRRQSLLIDNRYTPKSIAQKCMTSLGGSNNSPHHQQQQQQQRQQRVVSNGIANIKKQSSPGVINFFPNNTSKQQQNKLATDMDYNKCRLTSGIKKNNSIRTKSPSPVNSNSNFNEPQQVPVDFAQPKRRNLAKTLTNKSCTEQVSLLKLTYKNNQSKSSPIHEIANCRVEESLPEKMIIAAPKEKFEKSHKLLANSNRNAEQSVDVTTMQTLAGEQNQTSLIFPDEMPLGRVIKDIDLLKLILKALKWPVTNVTFELQMSRLRNSKFRDIMSDPNLLQDTDIVQLLQPYLAPVLLAAQAIQQQQQQFLKAMQTQNLASQSSSSSNNKPIDLTTLDINNSLPYKLPPETSVQLVPAQTNKEQKMNKLQQQQQEQQQQSQQHDNTLVSNNSLKKERKSITVKTKSLNPEVGLSKKARRVIDHKPRDSIIISDEENTNDDVFKEPRKPHLTSNDRTNSSKSEVSFNLDMNPEIINQLTMLHSSMDTSNEALTALLQRQNLALNCQQRAQRRRYSNTNISTLPSNEFHASINLADDIVLMEQENTNVVESGSNKNTKSNVGIIENLISEDSKKLSGNGAPVITRPIIKRRKTVIQTVPPRNKSDTDPVIATVGESKIFGEEDAAAQAPSNTINIGTQVTNIVTDVVSCAVKSTSIDTLPKSSTATSVCPLSLNSESTGTATQKSRKQLNTLKSTLGQQLLEAIGLQKVNNQKTIAATCVTTPTEAVTTSSTTESSGKESVQQQQQRSVLKRSLKQAQDEQQQRKQDLCSTIITTTTTTIQIQDADSTTSRSIVKEVIVEGKQNPGDISSMIDLEEQIDKVTLVRKPIEHLAKDTGKNIVIKKERKALTEKAKPGRKRQILANQQLNASSEEKSLSKIEEATGLKLHEENVKQPIENDTLNISSSSGAVVPIITSNNVTSTDVTPKRRGRKRNKDKELQATMEQHQDPGEMDKIKSKETDAAKSNEDNISTMTNSGRPTRHSKTLSKYYKGPEKFTIERRNLPTRATRNR